MNTCLARLLLFVCLAWPALSEAKPGLIVINYGDELFELPAATESQVGKPAGASVKLGYKCRHFGILWADVWTWDCRPVFLAGEDRFLEVPYALASSMAADPRSHFSKVKRSFWNQYAFWLAVAGLLGWLSLRRYRRRPQRAGAPAPRVERPAPAKPTSHGDFEPTVPAPMR